MDIAFIGLGTMGRHMAANLLKAGHRLVLYNRDRRKAEAFGSDVHIADTPGEAASLAEIVFTIVSDDQAVKEVYLGENGIVPALKKERGARIAVDCSTVSPNTSKELAEALSAVNVEFLDAPVTGSEPQAREGTLAFIVGGKKEIYEQCRPLFSAMGKKAVYLGKTGSGSMTKLANNALGAMHLVALSECLALVRKCGIDPNLFLEVVASGGARSGMAENKGPKILSGDYSVQFMTKLMLKDLRLATGLAESLGVPAPTLAVVKQMFQIACNQGFGEEDMSAVAKCYEGWIDSEK